jgi:putative membrane protein
MTRGNRIWIVCLAGLLTGGIARAADGPDSAKVLGEVHRSNQKEIEMGKMAQDHGLSKEVQSFGKTLAKDHAAADKKVVKLAKDEKVDLAANTPPAESQPDMTHTGAAFDNAFAKDMLDDHNKDVAAVTAARDATTDPKLKKLLTDMLPVLKKHQATAQKLVDQSGKDRS